MKKQYISLFVLIIVILSGCGFPLADADLNEQVQVSLLNTDGKEVGQATLTNHAKGVHILIKAEGLQPGTKAIHFHETALCEKPDFKTAGAHFNPSHKEHGFQNPKGYHLGDLPNIEVDANGKVEVETVSPAVVLAEGKSNSLLDADGSSIIIHQNADDYKTDPSGNSGDRIICGEIKK
ncbi:superoxide dismutase family protein [Psychrobacillus sp. OK032]|uniref:superoxide dismutase family protein n=1 Tax=Psychrobacillus sp. OK032 TaxID=1884358 RepID=UPI0008AAE3EA|nr:superoxide dismutase family protein [Psychrobacillus sp. OK032]SES40378.1 superoxide dismutase, Cu-Zn family [Psychrobacillus sp. OK032]